MLERSAQLRPAAVDPAPDGAQLDAQSGRYLLVRQALDVTEDDRGPVLGREGLQGRLDIAVQVPVVKGVRRRPGAVTEARGCVVAQALEPDSLLAAGHVEEQVGGDAVQPALERPRRVAGQRPEDAHKNLLGEVLSVVAVAGEPVGEAVDPGRVLPDDVIPAGRRPVGGGSRRWLALVHARPPHTAPKHCNAICAPGLPGHNVNGRDIPASSRDSVR